jgi:predicted PurR-regulated permease PerM
MQGEVFKFQEKRLYTDMKFPIYAKYTIILSGFLLFFFTLRIASTFLIPLFLGLLFSLLMLPFATWVEKKGGGKGLAAVLSILLVFIALAGFIYFFSLQVQNIAREGDKIQEQVQEFLNEVSSYLENEFGIQREVQEQQIDNIQEGQDGGFYQGVASMFPPLVYAIILIPLSMYFMLIYRNYYAEFLFKLYSEEKHDRIRKGIEAEKSIVIKYISGILTVVLILAVFNSIALTLFGLEHAIFFAVIAAFLNIIPIVGTLIGSTLPVIYALIMKDSLWYPVGIAMYFTFIQQLESYIITPNVVGQRVKINPYMIILAIFLGSEVWGPAGMVLFIPMLAIIKVLCKVVPDLHPYFFLLSDPDGEKDTMFMKAFKKVKGWIK